MHRLKVFLIALVLAFTTPVLLQAQAPETQPTQPTERAEDTDWGWLGLLGLIGLYGLRGKEARREATYERATGTHR